MNRSEAADLLRTALRNVRERHTKSEGSESVEYLELDGDREPIPARKLLQAVEFLEKKQEILVESIDHVTREERDDGSGYISFPVQSPDASPGELTIRFTRNGGRDLKEKLGLNLHGIRRREEFE